MLLWTSIYTQKLPTSPKHLSAMLRERHNEDTNDQAPKACLWSFAWLVQDKKVFKVEVVTLDHIDHIVLQWQSGIGYTWQYLKDLHTSQTCHPNAPLVRHVTTLCSRKLLRLGTFELTFDDLSSYKHSPQLQWDWWDRHRWKFLFACG